MYYLLEAWQILGHNMADLFTKIGFKIPTVVIILRLLYSVFFFQAEDGIRDAQESRGLGDVYKRQEYCKQQQN